jgi:hypothetical protein
MSAALSGECLSLLARVQAANWTLGLYHGVGVILPAQGPVTRKGRAIRGRQTVRKSANPTYICCSLL